MCPRRPLPRDINSIRFLFYFIYFFLQHFGCALHTHSGGVATASVLPLLMPPPPTLTRQRTRRVIFPRKFLRDGLYF